MQIVIDLPKEAYEYINTTSKLGWLSNKEFAGVIKNGIILPKGHGRLIDADALLKEHRFFDAYPFPSTAIDNAPTIIEAEKESEGVGKIHCTFTDAEIAKSFIEDVDAVKELLPQAESEEV